MRSSQEEPGARAHRVDESVESKALIGMIHGGARRRFGPGFADRVMDRVELQSSGFDVLLLRGFWRLAAATAAVAVVLAVYSLSARPYAEQTIVEAALGLQPVTLAAAYGLDLAIALDENGETS